MSWWTPTSKIVRKPLTDDQKLALENQQLRAELRQHYRHEMLVSENKRLTEQLMKVYQ